MFFLTVRIALVSAHKVWESGDDTAALPVIDVQAITDLDWVNLWLLTKALDERKMLKAAEKLRPYFRLAAKLALAGKVKPGVEPLVTITGNVLPGAMFDAQINGTAIGQVHTTTAQIDGTAIGQVTGTATDWINGTAVGQVTGTAIAEFATVDFTTTAFGTVADAWPNGRYTWQQTAGGVVNNTCAFTANITHQF